VSYLYTSNNTIDIHCMQALFDFVMSAKQVQSIESKEMLSKLN